MSRVVGIDYGSKRVGIAATDPLQIVSSAVGTFSPDEAVAFLQSYLQQEDVSTLVVGYPLNLNGQPAQAALGANQFAQRLRNKFPNTKVEQYDERFTSKMAMQALIAGGVKKQERRNKSLVDKVSACFILQSYLEYIRCRG